MLFVVVYEKVVVMWEGKVCLFMKRLLLCGRVMLFVVIYGLCGRVRFVCMRGEGNICMDRRDDV